MAELSVELRWLPSAARSSAPCQGQTLLSLRGWARPTDLPANGFVAH